MPITRKQKEEVVAKTTNAMKGAQSTVFVNFHGLSVSDTTQLRSNLREQNVGYLVAKKTLIKRVLDETKVKGDQPELEGELAIAYGDDLISPARGVYEFQKQHKDNISIIGGVFDGKYMNKEEMLDIATIPPTPVLYGQFLNLINSPIQRFVVALSEIAKAKEA
ncbi:MAG TPA: 50S ribosomal protein L10 [Candidatus Yonathbacteria bacterium]|nr:50S ribosomal protein L10 [Candidatus Yonathbacteria bacterium]